MLSSSAAPSLADRLATACYIGNLPSAKAAVTDGASVNESPPGKLLPLAAAVAGEDHDMVVWLLSHGADPNGDRVMVEGAFHGTTGILQLLIDVGGDVNRNGCPEQPLFGAVWDNSEDKVRVLLAQPSLNLAIKYGGKTPVQYARDNSRQVPADMIAQEVSRPFCLGKARHIIYCLC